MKFEEYLDTYGSLTYRFRGVSMMPMLRQGKDSFTVAKKTDARCKKLDVVLYRRGEKYILHRVVKVLPRGYVILGDNCYRKEYDITDTDILGVMTSFARGTKEYASDDRRHICYARIWYALYPVRFVFMWLFRADHPGRRVCRKIKYAILERRRQEGAGS